MARSKRNPKSLGPSRGSKAVTNVRRLWPYLLMAWERWQSLPDEKKEHYKRQAKDAADRGRKVLEDQRRKRGR
jgi:TRAP-type C4-dicarboxylate transport system substrate-binding protein